MAKLEGSYLLAQDGQFLGRVTANDLDTESLLNEYGPYGSQYSTTSIFNPFASYGSEYSAFSPNNEFAMSPPRLFIADREIGIVTQNEFLPHAIATDDFLHTLRTDIYSLLAGVILRQEK